MGKFQVKNCTLSKQFQFIDHINFISLQWPRRNVWRTNLLFFPSTLDCVRVFSSIMVCINCQHRCHLLFVYIFKHNIIDEHSHIANVIVRLSLGNFNHSTAIKAFLAHSDCIHWGMNRVFCIFAKQNNLIKLFFFTQFLVFVQYFLQIVSYFHKIEFVKVNATLNLILLHFVLFHRYFHEINS